MAAVMRRTEISVKRTGEPCTISNNDIAKLMYYFDCVCTCVQPDNSDTICRLRNFNNYASLSSDEEAQLLALCLALSPDKLIGSVLFPSSDCGRSNNKFLELSAVSTNMVVSDSFLIGGQRKKIQKIMMFEKCWIERNYLNPLSSIVRRQRAPAIRQPPPNQWRQPQLGQRAPVTRQLPPATRQPPPATRQPPPATRQPPPATRQPPPATRQQLPTQRGPAAMRSPPRQPVPSQRAPAPATRQTPQRREKNSSCVIL